jgi:hypothetical protein
MASKYTDVRFMADYLPEVTHRVYKNTPGGSFCGCDGIIPYRFDSASRTAVRPGSRDYQNDYSLDGRGKHHRNLPEFAPD